jgi:hypothetical protein
MDRTDKPNFSPRRFPTKSILAAKESRQKGREWWVGLKMDLKKIELIFCSSKLPTKTNLFPFSLSFLHRICFGRFCLLCRDQVCTKKIGMYLSKAKPLGTHSL